ncbi:MAG: hypothetical protein F6K44_19120 [Moorea sp. SIO3E2]|nr:hypothetical protein [Moorena sp. SIO3E2]
MVNTYQEITYSICQKVSIQLSAISLWPLATLLKVLMGDGHPWHWPKATLREWPR